MLSFSYTGLHKAAKAGDLETLKTLISGGEKVNKKCKLRSAKYHGYSPLMYAAEQGHLECTRFLLESGANVEMKDTFYLETAMHKAVRNGHTSCLELLLEYNANVNSKCRNVWRPLDLNFADWGTPLHEAVKHGQYSCVKRLLESGAKVNERDRFGNWVSFREATPLHWACWKGYSDITALLIRYGGNVHAPYMTMTNINYLCSGMNHLNLVPSGTALHLAARRDHISCIDTLILNKAHVNAKDHTGVTALDHACGAPIECILGPFLEKTTWWLKPKCNIETLDTLLEYGATESKIKSSSVLSLRKPDFGGIFKKHWRKLDVVPIFVRFETNALRRIGYKQLLSECNSKGWVHEGKKYLNLAMFSVNEKKTARLVIESVPSEIPLIKLEMFYPAKMLTKQEVYHCLPDVLNSVLEVLNTSECESTIETKAYVNPCYGSSDIDGECFIPNDKLRSSTGEIIWASCPNHHTVLEPDKMAPWFLNHEFKNGVQNEVERYLQKVAGLIFTEKILFEVGLGLGLPSHKIEEIRTNTPQDIVHAGFKMLQHWKNWKPESLDFDFLKETLENVFITCSMGAKFKEIVFP